MNRVVFIKLWFMIMHWYKIINNCISVFLQKHWLEKEIAWKHFTKVPLA